MATNDQSILTTVKRTLGLGEEYTVFDNEVITHINSVMGDLYQLGIGPPEGFEIESAEEKWSDLVGDSLVLSAVKSYVYLRVQMLFDPPTVGFVLTAKKEQIDKAEWRLTVARDELENPVAPEVLIFDGGSP